MDWHTFKWQFLYVSNIGGDMNVQEVVYYSHRCCVELRTEQLGPSLSEMAHAGAQARVRGAADPYLNLNKLVGALFFPLNWLKYNNNEGKKLGTKIAKIEEHQDLWLTANSKIIGFLLKKYICKEERISF